MLLREWTPRPLLSGRFKGAGYGGFHTTPRIGRVSEDASAPAARSRRDVPRDAASAAGPGERLRPRPRRYPARVQRRGSDAQTDQNIKGHGPRHHQIEKKHMIV